MTVMYDTVMKLGDSIIQHGKYNDRIYLLKLAAKDLPDIINQLKTLADTRNYSKIFAKIPMKHKHLFLKNGYRQEAVIPLFFRSSEDAAFMGKFFSASREKESREDTIQEILDLAHTKAGDGIDDSSPFPFSIIPMKPDDVQIMSRIYRTVFETYPFPIHDPVYLKETMEKNVNYFGVMDGDRLVALASSECDFTGGNAEMTDFATLPEYRRKGIAVRLLNIMEKVLRDTEISTVFTIARAYSAGMNITFAKMGYKYGGTLLNNTNISGSIESMNIWYKSLA